MIGESKLGGPEYPEPPSVMEAEADPEQEHTARVDEHRAKMGWSPESAVKLASLNSRIAKLQRQPPIGRIQGAMSGAGDLARVLAGLPAIAARSVAVLEQLETMTREGVTLSPETIAAMGRTESRRNRWRTLALWIIAATFIAILFAVRQL